jgi:hypothetical protein
MSLLGCMDALNEFCSGQSGVDEVEGKNTDSADDLMEMRGWRESRVDQGVQTLDDELRASEPNQRIGGRDEREGDERGPLHLDFST